MTVLTRTAFHPVILLILATAIAAGWRLFAVWDVGGLISTDGGAYLMQWYEISGQGSVSGLDIPSRTALGPGWQLWPFVQLLGVENGFRAWTALMPAVVIPCVYYFFRTIGSPRLALWASIALCFDWQLAFALSGGVLPYIAHAPILLIMAGIYKLRAEPDAAHPWPTIIGAWSVIIGIPLLAASSMSMTGAAAFVIFPTWCLALRLSRRAYLRLARVVILGAILAIPSASHYLASGPGSTPSIDGYPILRLSPMGFTIAVALIAAAAVYLARNAPAGIRACAITSLMAGIVSMLWSSNESIHNIVTRNSIITFILLVISLAWIIQHYLPRRLIGIATIAGIAYMASIAVFVFYNSYHYSPLSLRPDMYETVNRLIEESPRAVVANHRSGAHWITGYSGNEIETHWPENPVDGVLSDIAPCILGWISGCDPIAKAEEHGISHLVLDTYGYPWGFKLLYWPEDGRTLEEIDQTQYLGAWVHEIARNGDSILYAIH